jgi:hypothetical protein
MIWQFVKHFVSLVTFYLFITYTFWTLADARVKKEKYLENQNVTLGPCNIFYFIKVRPFLPRGFFTFFVALAHGAPRHGYRWINEVPRTILCEGGGGTVRRACKECRNGEDSFTPSYYSFYCYSVV